MIGNVWEWTTDWYSAAAPGGCAEGLLHPREPARRRARRASYDSVPAGDQHSAQGAEGRLAPVRAELLPALSAGRAPCPAGRYVDEPRRVSVRGPGKEVKGAANCWRITMADQQLAGEAASESCVTAAGMFFSPSARERPAGRMPVIAAPRCRIIEMSIHELRLLGSRRSPLSGRS